MAYFDGTELQPWPEQQRYTCIEKGEGGGLYRFVSLDGGFTADLAVDADGLVAGRNRFLDPMRSGYPGSCNRISENVPSTYSGE